MNETILAIGAAGKFAGLVLPELAKRGARVRGLVQRPEQVDQVRQHGAAEIAVGDLADRASLDKLLSASPAYSTSRPPSCRTKQMSEGGWSKRQLAPVFDSSSFPP